MVDSGGKRRMDLPELGFDHEYGMDAERILRGYQAPSKRLDPCARSLKAGNNAQCSFSKVTALGVERPSDQLARAYGLVAAEDAASERSTPRKPQTPRSPRSARSHDGGAAARAAPAAQGLSRSEGAVVGRAPPKEPSRIQGEQRLKARGLPGSSSLHLPRRSAGGSSETTARQLVEGSAEVNAAEHLQLPEPCRLDGLTEPSAAFPAVHLLREHGRPSASDEAPHELDVSASNCPSSGSQPAVGSDPRPNDEASAACRLPREARSAAKPPFTLRAAAVDENDLLAHIELPTDDRLAPQALHQSHWRGRQDKFDVLDAMLTEELQDPTRGELGVFPSSGKGLPGPGVDGGVVGQEARGRPNASNRGRSSSTSRSQTKARKSSVRRSPEAAPAQLNGV